ncbi:MAG: hypothetical protein METHP_00066 [Methanoregula sp. SKADARSKE-2]|nr:MAG: hypothetical protein METHP_00066 [Methanoregula sp. SKADARSKE-2]
MIAQYAFSGARLQEIFISAPFDVLFLPFLDFCIAFDNRDATAPGKNPDIISLPLPQKEYTPAPRVE